MTQLELGHTQVSAQRVVESVILARGLWSKL